MVVLDSMRRGWVKEQGTESESVGRRRGMGPRWLPLTYNAARYIMDVIIQSFQCAETHGLFITRKSRRWGGILAVALRRLDQLNAAPVLTDLAVPPGNRLEALRGSRKGQHSIRINDQWRICFAWMADGPHQVEIVDYH